MARKLQDEVDVGSVVEDAMHAQDVAVAQLALLVRCRGITARDR